MNSVDSRYIFDTCCVHLIISVALLCKDIAVIVVVPLFQWENPYTKITTPSYAFGHKQEWSVAYPEGDANQGT